MENAGRARRMFAKALLFPPTLLPFAAFTWLFSDAGLGERVHAGAGDYEWAYLPLGAAGAAGGTGSDGGGGGAAAGFSQQPPPSVPQQQPNRHMDHMVLNYGFHGADMCAFAPKVQMKVLPWLDEVGGY